MDSRDYWSIQLRQELDDALTTRSGDDTTELHTTAWTHSSGTEYQFWLLKGTAARSLRYVGVVAFVASPQRWRALYWELASAVSARLLELGDVTGVAAD